jgi:hypothetical protein
MLSCAPFHQGRCAVDYSREPPNEVTFPRNLRLFFPGERFGKYGFVSTISFYYVTAQDSLRACWKSNQEGGVEHKKD